MRECKGFLKVLILDLAEKMAIYVVYLNKIETREVPRSYASST